MPGLTMFNPHDIILPFDPDSNTFRLPNFTHFRIDASTSQQLASRGRKEQRFTPAIVSGECWATNYLSSPSSVCSSVIQLNIFTSHPKDVHEYAQAPSV